MTRDVVAEVTGAACLHGHPRHSTDITTGNCLRVVIHKHRKNMCLAREQFPVDFGCTYLTFHVVETKETHTPHILLLIFFFFLCLSLADVPLCLAAVTVVAQQLT